MLHVLQFPERFPAYFEYCWEKDRNVEFTRRQFDTSPQFHTYISVVYCISTTICDKDIILQYQHCNHADCHILH